MYKKKILVIGTLIIGILISIGMFFYEKYNYEDPRVIYRNEYGEGNKRALVDAEYMNQKRHIEITLDEREYKESELEGMSDRLNKELQEIISAGNQDLDNVITSIKLPSGVEGYPFYIRWEISDTDVINYKGEIQCSADCSKTHEVILTACVNYTDYVSSYNYLLKVKHLPMDEMTKANYRIDKNIETLKEATKYDKKLILPDEIDGFRITWSKPISKISIYIFIGSFITALILGWAYEKDEKAKEIRVRENLEELYPMFVDKLRMYLMSGLNTKAALLAIYKNINKSKKEKYNPLIQALWKMNNYFTNGVAEEKVYGELGRICGGSYKRLCFLLNVNLKQGNDQLLRMMSIESEKALTHRKNNAEKKCNESGVKLLFPMMLMLIVVMLMIMVPAYLGIV